MVTYQTLVKSYLENPREVHTVPLNKRIPRWFLVTSKDGKLYVEAAKNNKPACSISVQRYLNKQEFEIMLDLYTRRKKGEKVSTEATQASRNSVYWYGIFNDMGL